MQEFNFSPSLVLNTKRLTLRRLINDDAKDVFALRTNKDINKFIEKPPERQEKNGQVLLIELTKALQKTKSFIG